MKEFKVGNSPDSVKPSSFLESDGWIFEYEELEITVREFERDAVLRDKGDKRIVSMGTIVGEIYFMQGGPISYILWVGLEGLDKFFQELDELKANGEDRLIPSFFYGQTNERMANFSHRLGFADVECLGIGHEVIAPVNLVRSNLELIKQGRDITRFKQRAEQEVKKYDGYGYS